MRADGARPFEVVNPEGRADLLLLCDHASCAVPAELDNLGLAPEVIGRHIGWDIGAADLTRRLAALLDAPAVLAGFSRLLIDANRPLDHEHSIPAESDGVAVPGNRTLDPAEARGRAERWFLPYHREIEARLEALRRRAVPIVVAVHSFTPVLNGLERPWHAAVLHAEDLRVAERVHAAFRAYPEFRIGDNQPYTGYSHESFTLPHHAERHGLPHVALEVRQDLIDTPHGAERWAHMLYDVLTNALAELRLGAG